MNLIEKLKSLDAKRADIEARLEAQAADEDGVAAKVLCAVVHMNPTARSAVTSDKAQAGLTKKERALFGSWLSRNAPEPVLTHPAPAQNTPPAAFKSVSVNKNPVN